MSPSRHSLLAFATCLTPAFVLASPLFTPKSSLESLSQRDNSDNIHCGNAPNIVAGHPVTVSDIVAPDPNQNPPTATNDPSGYLPYLWCGADTSTFVFIDPIGNYGYNKGTVQPIFWTGLDGAYNSTQVAMRARAQSNITPNGDGSIDGSETSSQTVRIPVGNIAGTSEIDSVQVFVQDANPQKLSWGNYASAMTILKDFVLAYPLYADSMYFQIGNNYGTVGNGYMGIYLKGSTDCRLRGTDAQNNVVPCDMPNNYPDT